ncbi:MAG TPA: type I polyketide synthase [Streptosporangiaceae bacterium]|jgi:enediyne polyketide synthase
MSSRIAIVGVGCRYPDAGSPSELWENVLAGRRAFRRIPDERMRLADYWSADPAAPDRFYAQKAAVIEGYEFDRVGFKVAGSTFRTTDMTHWLALDTAARALADAGFPRAEGLPKTSTAVIVGNSLTGEFTRANLMRLRWPYVRRTVGAALREHGWGDDELSGFLASLEARYKSPFPPVDEDTLAGGLANTIAGRICNHFDLSGGGFTVDGACSSSLLAVAMACTALGEGQVDAAVVGGVDLSIDPFEVIGFAKTGALATTDMRVYDKNSNGFWPGEGCGMLVLLREQDAIDRGLRSYAAIAGWGYSSDGKGGMTRPEAAGHRLAIERAYTRAGFGIGSVGYLEGHGTGTAVGDATELRVFSEARRPAGQATSPEEISTAAISTAAISTVKGNIGHTKAAAGVAGLIKATLAVHHQVIPPGTGHFDPAEELAGARPALRVPVTAEPWPDGRPVRAGVSAMGFGGINAHIVLTGEGTGSGGNGRPSGGNGRAVRGSGAEDGRRRAVLDARTVQLVSSRQDCDLLLLDADNTAELRGQATRLAGLASKLSFAELGDLAATLQRELGGRRVRAAVVAASPEAAERGFAGLLGMLDNGTRSAISHAKGVFLGGEGAPSVGFMFPGQGSGKSADGGALARRFETARELYRTGPPAAGSDLVATAVAQPRIVTASVAGLRVLSQLGIEAAGATGHSLGELTTLHWAGALDERAVLALAAERGRAMAEASDGDGTMASVAAPPDQVEPLLVGEPVVIAGYNGPRQTVISGPVPAVDRVCELATGKGLLSARIAVSHAFHSPSVAPAASRLGDYLAGVEFRPLDGQVLSTVTGGELAPDTDLRELLVRQVLEPVRFSAALAQLGAHADLLIEVGPGRVLSGLAADLAPGTPVIPLETDGNSLAGLLSAVAAAYVLGAPVRHAALFDGRFTRPLPLDKEFRFFTSPCETVPADPGVPAPAGQAGPAAAPAPADPWAAGAAPTAGQAARPDGATGQPAPDSLDVLRQLAATRAELPLETVTADSLPLDELHLSSITVGQIMNQAARQLGLAAPMMTSGYATATLAELASALDDLAGTQLAGDAGADAPPAGVAPWVRAFSVDLVEQPPLGHPAGTPEAAGDWQVFASEGHPLASAAADALRGAGLGDGVLVCLPAECGAQHVPLMLAAAREALAHPGPCRFAVVQDSHGGSGLAKTLHLESPGVATTVITLPAGSALCAAGAGQAAAAIAADVAATTGFTEVSYDQAGRRRVPVLRPADLGGDGEMPLGSGDVLLVTGGGKGVTAECALALGISTGAAVGVLGRSDPQADAELAANLSRMAAAGLTIRYARADVTSPAEVGAAVREIRDALGPVTAVLHGAGRNEPAPLASLTEEQFLDTLAPKIDGLAAVLAAADPGSLKLLVTFGSIIGRAGLRGEAHYATANEWLTRLTQQVGEQHPGCRCLALEWSVWSGTGMGERLGVLESLTREGISPISVDDGVALLHQVLASPAAPSVLVIMGRASGLPTIALEPGELPLTRFIDQPRVYYPGIELVADAELSADSDLYLADHRLDGELLFPAVLGMEAMAQAAAALTLAQGTPVLEKVEFHRPIVIPAAGPATIRIAALNHGPAIEVVIRSADTGFQADHFRATFRYQEAADDAPGNGGTAGTGGQVPEAAGARTPQVSLDPARDLYGDGILFQGPRFQRVLRYRRLASTSCVAEISTVPGGNWFSMFLPGDLVLGDPGSRDAFMHAIQCCVPNATLLPAAVERLYPARPGKAAGRVVLHATERHRDGDTYVYDLDVRGADGELLEAWEGLRLQAVRKTGGAGPWVPALLGPYLERRAAELLPGPLRCAVEPDPSAGGTGRQPRRGQTALAVSRLTGHPGQLRHRPDGKPEVTGEGIAVSSSHGAGVTLAVAGDGPVGCDAESVRNRPSGEWQGLLGDELFALAELTARETGEELSLAATRVWGAVESLRKIGRAVTGPVMLAGARADGWVLFGAGRARIATFRTQLRDAADPVVFSILTEGSG